jgi:AraC-like DNA-binding protein
MIHYVRAGHGRFSYRGKEHTLGPGQIFIVSAGEWHRYEADREEPWSYSWICFGGTRAADLAPLTPVCTYPADTFRRALHADEYGDAAPEYIAGCLFEILSFLLREERLGGDGYAERARRIVDTLYMLPISVGSIAAQLSLDRRYLPRLFRARYGITLQEYLIRVRMEHAARYLEEGHNAEEAGRLSGYDDPVNFYRMFRRYFGESTGEYRRRLASMPAPNGGKKQNLQKI